jgi:predicted Rossmann-fold nucleotide-binding protein
MHNVYHEITTQEELYALLESHDRIERYAFQNMNFTEVTCKDTICRFFDCLFMGCTFSKQMRIQIDRSCLIFSHIDVPYNCFRNDLYNAESLYKGYTTGCADSYASCFDGKIYKHYLEKGKTATDIKETLARTLHDHSISDALHEFLTQYDEKKVIGIMGGHGLLRTDPFYTRIANLSKQFTELGYLMVSGGGPGAMEATHLGAWMAGRRQAEMYDALQILSQAPSYTDPLWLDTAFSVYEKYPQHKFCSLGIPTWLYGHEPATPFATHIAKYFENAIREDNILTIAKGGIIYTPGSAGTMQEIFQDAVQNHYLSFGYASPMVFLGTDYWTNEMPVYPLLQELCARGKYKNLILSLSDDESDIIEAICSFTEQTK